MGDGHSYPTRAGAGPGFDHGLAPLAMRPTYRVGTGWARDRTAGETAWRRRRCPERRRHVDAFADGAFDVVVCFTMLHHVPSPAAQDGLFQEVVRVLRAGGTFAGSDSISGPLFIVAHLGDTLTAIRPGDLPGRLLGAGLQDVSVDVRRGAFRWRGTTPASPRPSVRSPGNVRGRRAVPGKFGPGVRPTQGGSPAQRASRPCCPGAPRPGVSA